jgi:hypothetical protein
MALEPRTPSSGGSVTSASVESCAASPADEGVHRSMNELSQFRAWQEWAFRVSLCTLDTFQAGYKGIEFKLLREYLGGLLKPFPEEYHLNLSELHSRRHNDSAVTRRARS